jgi:hypothetical protein
MTQEDALKCARWLISIRGYENGVPFDKNRPTKLDGVPVEKDWSQPIADPVKRAIIQWLQQEGFLSQMNEPEKDIFVMTVTQTLLTS